MSVDIEPLELSFRRPFTREVSQTLTVRNPSTTPVVFKVKTTAPKQYCVRPNAGRIEPGQDFDVSVLLQAMKQEPAADAKCRDKFLVQSAPITSEKQFESIASVFETTEKTAISERKIRVNWLQALGDDDASPAAAAVTPSKQTANGLAADTPEASRSFASPSGAYGSPLASDPPPYTDDVKSEPEDSQRPETPRSAVSGTAKSAYEGDAGAATSTATATTNEVRQRVKSASESVQQTGGQLAQAVPQTVQGVSVPIVALLCFLAFLAGYIFF